MKKILDFLKSPLFITLIIIIAGMGGIVYAMTKLVPEDETESAAYVERYWGKAESPVVITKYTDFACPGCGTMHQTVDTQLKANFGDKVKFVNKHLPLRSLHPTAERAAQAAEAAGAQGKYWEYVDILYTRASAESALWSVDKLVQYAEELGLDTAKFRTELTDSYYKKIVTDSAKEAGDKGYASTPTYEINGVEFNGANGGIPTYQEFEARINELLGTAPTPETTPTTSPEATVVPNTQE